MPSQLLNIEILKSNSPVLLNLLVNIFSYCPAVRVIRRTNSSNIDLQEGQFWSCNRECLYCDLSRDIWWNIAWALGKSLGFCPLDFPGVQAIFHRISLLLSQNRFSITTSLASILALLSSLSGHLTCSCYILCHSLKGLSAGVEEAVSCFAMYCFIHPVKFTVWTNLIFYFLPSIQCHELQPRGGNMHACKIQPYAQNSNMLFLLSCVFCYTGYNWVAVQNKKSCCCQQELFLVDQYCLILGLANDPLGHWPSHWGYTCSAGLLLGYSLDNHILAGLTACLLLTYYWTDWAEQITLSRMSDMVEEVSLKWMDGPSVTEMDRGTSIKRIARQTYKVVWPKYTLYLLGIVVNRKTFIKQTFNVRAEVRSFSNFFWTDQFELIFHKFFPKTNKFSSLVTKPLKKKNWRTFFNFCRFLELIHLQNRVFHTYISINAAETLQCEDLAV